MKETLSKLLADHSGQPLEKVANDTERDYFMSGDDAKSYGIIDEIISRNVVAGGSK
jgi:ATP-dependent Clp protease protease subunit